MSWHKKDIPHILPFSRFRTPLWPEICPLWYWTELRIRWFSILLSKVYRMNYINRKIVLRLFGIFGVNLLKQIIRKWWRCHIGLPCARFNLWCCVFVLILRHVLGVRRQCPEHPMYHSYIAWQTTANFISPRRFKSTKRVDAEIHSKISLLPALRHNSKVRVQQRILNQLESWLQLLGFSW